MILNESQQEIYDKAVTECGNICINGPAGVGKSVIVNILRNELPGCQVLAPTGVAALNVNGMTIHRFFSLLPHMKDIEDCKRPPKINWYKLKTLIFDEISMIQPNLFILIDKICRRGKRNQDVPFGGVKVILVGDWYQLAPIPDGISDKQFIFQTDLWKEMNVTTFNLNTVMRQTDSEFIRHLHNIRVNNLQGNDTIEFLDKLRNNKKDNDKHYVKLYSKNVDKKFANEQELELLDSKKVVFKSKDTGDKKYLVGHRVEEVVELKAGASVMLLWNIPELQLSNGSIGKVISFIDGIPNVKFENDKTLVIIPQLFEIVEKCNGKLKVLASRAQIPLALAYAITVHKSQGLSFDNVEFFCDGIFAPGQFYTGISRGRNSETMILRNFDERYIRTYK